MAYYRDLEDDIARGLVSGSSPFGSFGKMVTTGAVTNQVVWPDGTWAIPPTIKCNIRNYNGNNSRHKQLCN